MDLVPQNTLLTLKIKYINSTNNNNNKNLNIFLAKWCTVRSKSSSALKLGDYINFLKAGSSYRNCDKNTGNFPTWYAPKSPNFNLQWPVISNKL